MIRRTLNRVDAVLHPDPRNLVRTTLGLKPICVVYGRIPVALGFAATESSFAFGFGYAAWKMGLMYLSPAAASAVSFGVAAAGLLAGANVAVACINIPEYVTPRLLRRAHVNRRKSTHILHASQIVGWATATSIGLLPIYATPPIGKVLTIAAEKLAAPVSPDAPQPMHQLVGPSP